MARETLSTACDGSAAVGGSLRFEATAVGGGCDNPSDRFDLVVVPCGDECGEDGPCCGSGDDGCHADQAERSVTLAFRNASAVEIRLSASPEAGPRNWGRNFLFAGASGLVKACPAPDPSPRPSADAEAREDEAHLEFFADDGQIAWSRSRERTVRYRWILRLLAGLGVAAVLCLEPLVAILGQNVSDRHRRVHLFLAIMEQGFGACFLLELRATRPVLFLVEGAVVAGCSVASTVLVARLARAPGLKPSLDRRERALAAAIALWAALDTELVPLLPWAPAAETDAGKRLQRKHLASNFPTVATARASLVLDLCKHGVTTVVCLGALAEPSTRCVVEFATFAVSASAVLLSLRRRYVVLRRKRAKLLRKPSSDADGQTTWFTTNPLSFKDAKRAGDGAVELPARLAERRASAGSGVRDARRSTTWANATPPV